jgi:hypothetical protein
MSSNIIFDICTQRRRQQLFNVPPVRTELETSPYGKPVNGIIYTKQQIDMRRKAEILKYNSNVKSTQTNNLTKSQKYALLVNGKTQTLSQEQITKSVNNNNICPNDNLIPTPTSSCDVPGPVMYLIDDENVPLYNYVNPTITRSYAIMSQDNTDAWSISKSNDIMYTDNSYNTLCSIYIRYLINQPYTVFNINTPIGLNITGNVIDSSGQNINIQISGVKIYVFYNNTIVTSSDTSIKNSYGISSPTITNNTINMTMNTYGKRGRFQATQYMGNIGINNLTLYTTPGYIYDIKLVFNLTITPLSYTVTYYNSFNSSIIANISSTSTVSTNCNILSTSPVSSYSPFSMASTVASVGTSPV